jgi:hypothetical protein
MELFIKYDSRKSWTSHLLIFTEILTIGSVGYNPLRIAGNSYLSRHDGEETPLR